MVSGANVMDFRIENLKSATLGGTRRTRRWMADLQKTVARFSALSRHELASTLCSHLGWVHAEGSGSTRVLQVAGSRLGPGGCFGPALAAAARAEHAGGRAVHVPVGVLEGASGICGHAGRTVGATRPMGPDGGGHGMKSKPKRGADRLVRRMAKGVRPARMEVDCSGGGGELSSNGGSALLMMLAEQVRLFERVSACFTDHRDPSKVVHPLVALLGQRILGLALGYEDVNDHDELRRDRSLSTAMGRVECARSDCEPLAGKSTLNWMELSANGRDPAKARQITVDFDALDELLVELYLVCGERGQMPKRLVLDIDATDVELHGRRLCINLSAKTKNEL